MFRNILVNEQKAVYGHIVAHAELKTGMGVQLSTDYQKTAFPGAATGSEIFVVDHLRTSNDPKNSFGYISDADPIFNVFESGEVVKLRKFEAAEQFETDQVGATVPSKGDSVVVGTDGKWVKASASAVTPYVCVGVGSDSGLSMYRIMVLDTPVTVA